MSDTIFISTADGHLPQIVVVDAAGREPVPGRGYALDEGLGIVAEQPLDDDGKLRLYVPRAGDRYYVRLQAGIGFADACGLLLDESGMFAWADDLPCPVRMDDGENLYAARYGASVADQLMPVKVQGA